MHPVRSNKFMLWRRSELAKTDNPGKNILPDVAPGHFSQMSVMQNGIPANHTSSDIDKLPFSRAMKGCPTVACEIFGSAGHKNGRYPPNRNPTTPDTDGLGT